MKVPDRIKAWRLIYSGLLRLGFKNIDGGDTNDGGLEETYKKGDLIITIKYKAV